MMIDLPATKVIAYASTAKRSGCPRSQLESFLQFGYVALPWALPFHAVAREADYKDGPDEIGIGGSRGPGKSHAIFAQVVEDCLRFPGVKALYLRKVGKQAREQLEDLRVKVLRYVPHDFNRVEGVIRFTNGSRIIVGHFKNESDVDQYLGLEYEIIAIEEATSLTVTKYKAVRDSNRSSIPGMRPRIYNSTNPGGVGHAWYKAKFVTPHRNGKEKYTRFFPATVEDNIYIDDGYRRKLEENTGWRLRAYRYGDWDIAAGQFFSTWRHEAHVITPFDIPRDWEVWASLDYGFVHFNVIHIWAKSGDGTIYTIEEYAAQRQQVEDHAREYFETLDRLKIAPSRVRRFPAGTDVFVKRDPASPTIANQYKSMGIRLTPARTDRINGWAEMLKRLGDIDREDHAIPPTWFIFETCSGLINTLPMLEHNPNNPEDVLKVDVDEDGNGGDDFADCARYGLMEGAEKRRATAGTAPWKQKRKPVAEIVYRSDDEVEQLLKEAEYE